MKNSPSKLALAAAFGLALAFTFSCSSSDGGDPGGGGSQLPSSSSRRNSSSFNNDACKNIVFNASTNFCYDGIVYDKCNGMGYNPSTHICDGSAAYPAKCNGEQYNPLEFGCCDDYSTFNLSNQRCQDDVVQSKCGEIWYRAEDMNLRCQSDVIEIRCNSSWYKYNTLDSTLRCYGDVLKGKCRYSSYSSTTHFCSNNVIYSKCGGSEYNIETQGCCNNIKYSTIETQYCSNGTLKNYDGSVTYEGKTYKTVVIGEQIWMAENLNYNASGSKCFDNKESNCATYGRLYDWNTAIGVCPPGWHLPSNDEWQILVDFIGGREIAGTKLKATSGWSYREDWATVTKGFVNGEDAFGFSALPGGVGRSDGDFDFDYAGGLWWSSTKRDVNTDILSMLIKEYDEEAYVDNCVGKNSLLSVRCIKDN